MKNRQFSTNFPLQKKLTIMLGGPLMNLFFGHAAYFFLALSGVGNNAIHDERQQSL